jgi:rhamnosyltransferase subunit B
VVDSVSSPRSRPLQVLLPTLGSAGDVHPFIALGLALKARGHRATIITNPMFQPLIETQGLGFVPMGTVEEAQAIIANPDLWHPRKSFDVVAERAIVPAMEPVYRAIERLATANTVVVASSLALGARLAQEKLGLPTATVHLQPSVLRSLVDQGMMGTIRISAAQPAWFKRALYWLADRAVIDRILKQPLNDFRYSLGLAPVDRVMQRWMHSPQCVIGFFPAWFATPQPDWPPNTHLVGFPLWDGGNSHAAIRPEVAEFLNAGEAPVIFTPGSAAATQHRYFHESLEAVRELGMRAMFVTNFPEQVPAKLPAGVQSFTYLPFSEVLPRAVLLVYHGGIGTLAQAISAGIPHLVVPNGHDQFDNGWRIAELRLGRSLPQTRYRARSAAAAIRMVLGNPAFKQRAREYAARVNSNAALDRACDLVEGLAAGASQ